jgi:hypothetical protein
VAFLLASATISVTNASDIKDRYIRQAIVRPTRPIGQDVPDVDVLFEDPQKGRRKLTSSKSSKSDSSNKSSKSDKSSKQETYYLVVYPTPPKSQSSSWLGESITNCALNNLHPLSLRAGISRVDFFPLT